MAAWEDYMVKKKGEEQKFLDVLTGNKLSTLNVGASTWLDHQTLKTPDGRKATMDPKMVCVEVYNPNKLPVAIVNTHPLKKGGFDVALVQPDNWLLIPHQYWTPYLYDIKDKKLITDGTKFKLTKNFGDSKFKKIKKPPRK